MGEVLGIEVDDGLRAAWSGWLAPAVQPFFVQHDSAEGLGGADAVLTAELRDTYRVWRLGEGLATVWLGEERFVRLDDRRRAAFVRSQAAVGRGAVPSVRAWSHVLDRSILRSLGDGHRFVWWPSLLHAAGIDVVAAVVSAGRLASRHAEVEDAVWERCAAVLPGAQRLAGSFAKGSGPNCFGTVMGAAGVDGASEAWVQQPAFEAWLGKACRAGGDDDRPGTVLVWRRADGLAVHAAVTIGGGWALEKPSQEWSSPRAVLSVQDVIRASRARGQRLERHSILGGVGA